VAIEHYQSSKGPRRIDEMTFPHLNNAIVIVKAQDDPERADELAAMIAQRDRLEAAYQEREAANVGVGA